MEPVLVFVAGVATGVARDRWLLGTLVDAWIDRRGRMGGERRDDVPEGGPADVHSSARIAAAAALTLVLVVLLVVDVAVRDYHVSPGILLPLLGAILALLGLGASATWRAVV